MDRTEITEKLLSLTPEELQRVIDTIHSWNSADYGYDEEAGEVETAADIIDLLSREEYNLYNEPVDRYFSNVFGV